MSTNEQPEWAPTSAELAPLITFALSTLGLPLLPAGALVAALGYAYTRRKQLFPPYDGTRLNAGLTLWDEQLEPTVSARGSMYQLPHQRLHIGARPLTVVPRLTAEAAGAGLGAGDAVPLAVVNNGWGQRRSSLVVPAKIDEPVTVVLPPGDYTLLALAGRQDRLFDQPDPYLAIGGSVVHPLQRPRMDLALQAPWAARGPLSPGLPPLLRAKLSERVSGEPRLRSAPARQGLLDMLRERSDSAPIGVSPKHSTDITRFSLAKPPGANTRQGRAWDPEAFLTLKCIYCGRTGQGFMHTLTCPERPGAR